MHTYISKIEILEGSVARMVEGYLYGHHFGHGHFVGFVPQFWLPLELFVEKISKFFTKVIDGNKNFSN
ncbi:MAG TPA: hypothetical protein PKA53_12405, partial [Sphingobacterium sp.]|nr:hypothetical protein [Sphingobacterium sp.]